MSLSCKAGVYGDVLHELMKLQIPVGDIHLLFGPMDILCRFEFDTLDEFKDKWFNRVRMIGAEEGWITRTMTFIVIERGGETTAIEPFAFIFLNTQPRNLESVQRALLSLPGILTADTVFGPYDVICSVRAENRSQLEQVVSRIHKDVPGIEGSSTSIVALMQI